VGSKLSKRLSLLQNEVDDSDGSPLSFGRVFLFSLVILGIFAFLLGTLNSVSDSEYSKDQIALANPWEDQTRRLVTERISWLEGSWLGESGADFYREFAKGTVTALLPEGDAPLERGEIDLFSGASLWLAQAIVGVALRVVFLGMITWPFWIAGAILGGVAFHTFLRTKRGNDVLGICDRGRSPFYSGIYGPLRSNHSPSATDFSCPGLACPDAVPRKVIQAHKLGKALEHFGAANEANFQLAQVVLAYGDYPSYVEEERLIEEETEGPVPFSSAPATSPVRSNKDGRLDEATLEGLSAILIAHKALRHYYSNVVPDSADEAHFREHLNQLERLGSKLRPLSRWLLQALTPSRGKALAELTPALVATAYLAIEAGKSLVFQRDKTAYVQISRFPHLQARAVLQSFESYHNIYKGDDRMLIRQAVLFSRRHGDFGRAFLPVGMSVASRALRDWLEILYAAQSKRQEAAFLVELDAHIEEISHNWRQQLSARLHDRADRTKNIGVKFPENSWKGVPFRSVVLMPLRELVVTALDGLTDARISRIKELVELTRTMNSKINISARLPGFKRQAIEAEKGSIESGGVTSLLAERHEDAGLVERWLIVRRMLTRYNWLSTRVGDDAVPVDGIVQAFVVYQNGEKSGSGNYNLYDYDALVPLRQRRFRELFGSRWHSMYYAGAPKENGIEVYVDTTEFMENLQERKSQIKNGQLDIQAASGT
jgi:hypothetical protein